ncbi:hypothetical protein [Pseudomonas sp. NW5]|uniref:hypothetical protein n=1 Tax=Pseudomonas sp. NW5 TaxID=2934934 RepID=UPI0020212D47|nr:hypothetical protein [Pseudomonas sp. NW5]MCL7463391.1 hypothetical protein [Pseudomonas sp. NW5]
MRICHLRGARCLLLLSLLSWLAIADARPLKVAVEGNYEPFRAPLKTRLTSG